MTEDRHLRGDGAKTGADADALDAERLRDPELDRAFHDDRDTYERAADAEREAGRAAREAARDDYRGER